MNLVKIETRFKDLDHKARMIRDYYDPSSNGKSRHVYIEDLKGDKLYNDIVFGMKHFVK